MSSFRFSQLCWLERIQEATVLVVEIWEDPEIKANDPEKRVDHHSEDENPEVQTQKDDAQVPDSNFGPNGPNREHASE